MKRYSALLLDMDGTFLDFAATEKKAFSRAMRQYGFPAGEEEYRIYTELNLSLWEAHERGELDKDRLLATRFGLLFGKLGYEGDGAAFERVYQQLLGEGHDLIQDADEVLSWLSERYPLYVVTNGVEVTQRNRLRLSGIEKYMTDLFISESVGFQKPRSEFFDYCFERMGGVERRKTLIVGDSLTSDIQGGINAGLDTCWFNPERKSRNRKSLHPAREAYLPGYSTGMSQEEIWKCRQQAGLLDLEIRSLRELMDILQD